MTIEKHHIEFLKMCKRGASAVFCLTASELAAAGLIEWQSTSRQTDPDDRHSGYVITETGLRAISKEKESVHP